LPATQRRKELTRWHVLGRGVQVPADLADISAVLSVMPAGRITDTTLTEAPLLTHVPETNWSERPIGATDE
jgi:hypothetical protein